MSMFVPFSKPDVASFQMPIKRERERERESIHPTDRKRLRAKTFSSQNGENPSFWFPTFPPRAVCLQTQTPPVYSRRKTHSHTHKHFRNSREHDVDCSPTYGLLCSGVGRGCLTPHPACQAKGRPACLRRVSEGSNSNNNKIRPSALEPVKRKKNTHRKRGNVDRWKWRNCSTRQSKHGGTDSIRLWQWIV